MIERLRERERDWEGERKRELGNNNVHAQVIEREGEREREAQSERRTREVVLEKASACCASQKTFDVVHSLLTLSHSPTLPLSLSPPLPPLPPPFQPLSLLNPLPRQEQLLLLSTFAKKNKKRGL